LTTPGPVRPRVLLVEDDPVYVRIVRYSLGVAGARGFDVEVVDALEAALRRLEQDDPDAVVLDLGLPDARGVEAVRSLCGTFPLLPVVVLTAVDDEAMGLQAVQAGAQDYLVKGQVEKDLLPRAVRYAIERKRTVDTLRRLEKAVHTMQLGVSITDLKGRIVYANPAEAEMHGYTVPELLGRDARSLSPREDWSPPSQEDVARMKRWKRERLRLRRDGTVFPVQLMSDAVMDAAGRPIGIVTTCEDITDRRSMDPLTGVPNRSLFMERLDEAFSRSQRRPGGAFGVLFVDLDHFKQVNDTLGHQAGDQFLVTVARRLELCVRPGDTVGRIGGDEFALILERLDAAEDATRVAERVLCELRQPVALEGGPQVTPSASVGIALSTTGYERAEDLLRDADTAMYRAKSGGRGRWEVFDRTMRERLEARRRLQDDLRRGIDRNEFRVHFQPIVCLGTGALRGFEALLRWRSLLLPVDALTLSDDTAWLTRIGDWLLREACREAGGWRALDPTRPVPMVSVNVSRIQFERPELPQELRALLEEHALPAAALAVEVSEETILGDGDATSTAVSAVRALGVGVRLDRFGTGYASLSALRRHPLTGLKLDSSVVAALDREGPGGAFAEAILRAAAASRIPVTATGIETAAQLHALRALGCAEGQGAFLAPPLDAAEASALIAARRSWASLLEDPPAARG
jgi:diguanylate cyclase (GGDEF)-like protein/PAS domain S-box-containing protein